MGSATPFYEKVKHDGGTFKKHLFVYVIMRDVPTCVATCNRLPSSEHGLTYCLEEIQEYEKPHGKLCKKYFPECEKLSQTICNDRKQVSQAAKSKTKSSSSASG